MNISPLQKLLLASSLAVATLSHGAVITFDAADEFNNNFRQVNNPGSTLWTTGGFLTKTTNTAFTAVYNINDNGTAGTNQAASTYDNPRTLIGGSEAFTLSADFQTSNLNTGNSFGFYVKIPDATANTTPSGGYAVLFRLDDNGSTAGGNIDVRFYDYSTSNNIGNAGVGTVTSTQTISSTPGPVDTWYTAQLTVQDVGSDVAFTATVF
jgi:hypothetical protein